MANAATAALTILIGVTVYVLGRIIERAFIEPLNDYRRLVMEIAGALAMHSDYWGDTTAAVSLSGYGSGDEPWRVTLGNATDAAAMDLRSKGARLKAYAATLPWYRVWSMLHLMPQRSDLLFASGELARISNRLPASSQDDVVENALANSRIQELLRIATR
jgi:hypothetical protein